MASKAAAKTTEPSFSGLSINNPDVKAKMDAMAKKFDRQVMHNADDLVQRNRLPFKQPNLNRATWGGMGFGLVAAFYGDESTGKSRIALEQIAQLQQLPGSAEVVLLPRIAYHTAQADNKELSDRIRRNHEILAKRLQDELDWIRKEFPNGADAIYYNAEQQFDKVYAEKIGIDNKKLWIVDSLVIEEIVEIMQNFFEHVPMHVVDSTSSASSNLMLKEDVGKSLMAVDARQWKQCLKGAMTQFDPNRNIAILIHQMGTNLRTGGSQPVSSKFLKHTSSLSLRFTRGRFLYNKDGVLVEELPAKAAENALAIPEADGIQVFAKVEKSRTCRPHMSAGLQWDYKKLSYLPIHELASSGLYYGYIEQKGSWFKVAGEDSNLGQGLKSVYARLENDPELCDSIMVRQMDYTAEM